jgi:hypothetical protein
MTVRTQEEVNQQLDKVNDNINKGISKYPGMTYEEGIRAAIDWMSGESDEPPMDDTDDTDDTPMDDDDL